MMGAADEGTGSHVLADRVRQDLSRPRSRHRREGLFGVDSRRRMSAQQCKYHTHPCGLSLSHCQRELRTGLQYGREMATA